MAIGIKPICRFLTLLCHFCYFERRSDPLILRKIADSEPENALK
ncbi:hypothetical protein ACQ86O_23760 [Serratia sp. L9]